MPSTNTTISTAETTYLNKTYYDRNLLENAKTKFVHANYGQKKNIPKNSGKRVEFRRWMAFDPSVVVPGLTEGVTPEGQSLKQGHVEAEIKQYGAYTEVSDLLKTTAFDDVVEGSTDLLGEQVGTAIEWITRDAMALTTNVQFAGGKTSRETVAATDILTTTEVRKAVRTLKKAKARTFTREGGKAHYIAIVSPDAVYDLQSDPLWQDVSKYSNAEQLYSGEIGRIFGVVFVESTEAKIYDGEGSGGGDVHCTLIFGQDAYGVIDIEGSGALKTIIKKAGSAGSADPLDQRATVGAKVEGYAVAVLNDDWILALEHGVTA